MEISSLVFGLAADNFDLLNFDLLGVVKLELDVFDDESPNFVTEAVGIEMALKMEVQHDESAYLLDLQLP